MGKALQANSGHQYRPAAEALDYTGGETLADHV